MKEFLKIFVISLISVYVFAFFGEALNFQNFITTLIFIAFVLTVIITAFINTSENITKLEQRIKALEEKGIE